MTPRPASRVFVSFAWLALCAGCDENLPKATEIARMRLLGAKVQVVGDETRATPKPGEKVDVSLVSAYPTLAGSASGAQTMLVSCTQPERYTGGLPVCQEFLDAALGGAIDVKAALDIPPKVRCADLSEGFYEVGTVALRCIDGDPEARIRVDRTFSAREMLYRGVVCERGQAHIDVSDPLIFGCDDNDGETFRVHGTVAIEHDAKDANHNPTLDAARFFLGNPNVSEEGAAWPWVATDDLPAEDDCLGGVAKCNLDAEDAAGVLCDYAYSSHQITIQFDPKARERFEGKYEDLELSLFATDGELARRFVVFESEMKPVRVQRPIVCRTDADCADHPGARCRGLNCRKPDSDEKVTEEADVLQDTVDWKVPAALRSRSQLVRFFFTALDRRGGFDWTTRALCLN